jgi:hypothetical protein
MKSEYFREMFEYLRLPALAEEEGDPLGRAPGEALDPDRYPASYLKRIANDPMQRRKWRAQYQQAPTSDVGDIFSKSWWQYYDREDLERLGLKAKYIYVDPAFGGNAKNGWSQILVNELRSSTPGDDGALSFPVIPYKLPGGNRTKGERATAIKTATAESVTAMVEGGMVFLPRGASWLDYALDQLTAFPSGEHDDVVDALVAGLTHMGIEHNEAINHFYFQSVPVVQR